MTELFLPGLPENIGQAALRKAFNELCAASSVSIKRVFIRICPYQGFATAFVNCRCEADSKALFDALDRHASSGKMLFPGVCVRVGYLPVEVGRERPVQSAPTPIRRIGRSTWLTTSWAAS